jgi:hypothetical protein
MFVQVIQGKVSDAGEARAAFDRWVQELAPSATGWLGSTAGVTEDGQLIAIARFDSEESARRNSDRQEQGQWWEQTAKLFTEEATFKDSTEVDIDQPGDPDKARFVQVIQGRTSDPARARELMRDNPDTWAEFRPDILGSVGAGHEGGAYTAVLYFTTEEEAREGERKEVPPEMQAQMEEMGKLEIGQPTFLDIKEPWLYSPR